MTPTIQLVNTTRDYAQILPAVVERIVVNVIDVECAVISKHYTVQANVTCYTVITFLIPDRIRVVITPVRLSLPLKLIQVFVLIVIDKRVAMLTDGILAAQFNPLHRAVASAPASADWKFDANFALMVFSATS